MTFSILGRCERTGRFGVALTSSSPAVAARCAFVRAGAGAAATQNVTDPRLGPALLTSLARGHDASAAVDDVVAIAPHAEYRQLAAVGASGAGATFSGGRVLGEQAARTGAGWAAAGNMLATTSVLDAVAGAFACSDAEVELERRLLDALAAGVAAGGEAGALCSAGVVATGADGLPWPVTDLRVDVDTASEPVAALMWLWELWAPQREDYVVRALNPAAAPSYGVPGDPGAPAEAAS